MAQRKIKCAVPNCHYESKMGINCLIKHCEDIHHWGVYKCTKNKNCLFESYCHQSLQSHIAQFHKERKVRGRGLKVCSKEGCSASFFRSLNLKLHEDIHNNTLRFECSYCQYRTGSTTKFSDHLAIHFGDNRYECDKCGHIARTKKHLRCHKELHTERKYNLY